MSASALDAATAILETRVPGGGGPPDIVDPDRGGGGGGGDGDNSGSNASLYRLGTWLAIASIAALFIALAVVFWVRSRTAFLWEPVEVPHALWVSTAILGCSSWMFELSRHALRGGHWFAYRRRLLLTVYLGLAFFASQAVAVVQLSDAGALVRGNPHAAVFYIFTAAHGVHLALGIGALAWLLTRRGRDTARHTTLAASVGLFWHFLGVLWLGLFALLLAL